MKNAIATLGRALTTPLPGTPGLGKYTPSLDTIRRHAALAMAMVVLYTQSVCAGTASFPLWPSARRSQPSVASVTLLDRLIKLVGADKKKAPHVFHASLWNYRRHLTAETV